MSCFQLDALSEPEAIKWPEVWLSDLPSFDLIDVDLWGEWAEVWWAPVVSKSTTANIGGHLRRLSSAA